VVGLLQMSDNAKIHLKTSHVKIFESSLSGSSPLCVIVISNIKKISGEYVKTQQLLYFDVLTRNIFDI